MDQLVCDAEDPEAIAEYWFTVYTDLWIMALAHQCAKLAREYDQERCNWMAVLHSLRTAA